MDWAAIGVISGVTIAGLGYLSAQLNRLDDKLTGRIDDVDDKLTGRIDDVEARLGAKIDVLTERYISHLERHPR